MLVDAPSFSGEALLFYGAKGRNTQAIYVKMLLMAGADVNHRLRLSGTTLLRVATWGDLGRLLMLVADGSNAGC